MKRELRRFPAYWAVVAGLLLGGPDSWSDWRFGGYAKSFAIGSVGSPLAREDAFQSLNAFRFNLKWMPEGPLELDAHYELQPVLQTQSATFADAGGFLSTLPLGRGGNSYRIVDLEAKAYQSERETFVVFQNLDRLSLRWELGPGDFFIGRQAVTFGSARMISPTDVLLPFAVQQLNVEYRIGVDAARYRLPLGDRDELDLGVVVGDQGRFGNSSTFARLVLSKLETDFVIQAMSFSGAWLVGGGMQRSLWDLGWTLDVAEVFGEPTPSYFRLTTGLDYSFANGLLLMTEYHFNGAGSSRPEDYGGLISSFAYSRGGVFLLGRHYLIPGASYSITPLLAGNMQLLWNLPDQSLLLSPSLEYNVIENGYVDLGAFLSAGAGVKGSGQNLVLGSEYGTFPKVIYLDFRYYF